MAAIEENDDTGIAALEQPHFLLGYRGVEASEWSIQGDESTCTSWSSGYGVRSRDTGEWTVKVSAESGFPRRDGPSEELSERAAWQYKGPLSRRVACRRTA